jgi:hypothetical protein
LTLRIFEKALTVCKQNDWPVLALIVKTHGERLDDLTTLLQHYEIESITVPDKNERPDLFYPVDGHWNAKGHAFVAGLIVERLTTSDYDLSTH